MPVISMTSGMRTILLAETAASDDNGFLERTSASALFDLADSVPLTGTLALGYRQRYGELGGAVTKWTPILDLATCSLF